MKRIDKQKRKKKMFINHNDEKREVEKNRKASVH